MRRMNVSVSEAFYWSSFKWWRTDGSWDQRWMVEHPRFKHEKVTMVIKIIIGIMICRDCIASGQNSIMISSQMSDFGHLWHAHPQRWACHRCPEKWQYRTSVAWFSCHRCPCHRCGASWRWRWGSPHLWHGHFWDVPQMSEIRSIPDIYGILILHDFEASWGSVGYI